MGRWESSPAAANSLGPNPKVTVSRAGMTASSGSVSASAGRPWVRRAASSVSSRIIRPRAAAIDAGQQVEGEERGVRLGRGVDTGLVKAVEGHRFGAERGRGERRCRGQRLGRGERVGAGGDAGPDDTPTDGQGAAAEQSPPGQRPVGRTHQLMVIGLALMPGL